MSIADIPLDAWATVMIHINQNDLVNTFNVLMESGVLNIDERHRLDTFYILMALVRIKLTEQVTEEIKFPDADFHRLTFHKLIEMGINKETAASLVRKTNGDLIAALTILNWV